MRKHLLYVLFGCTMVAGFISCKKDTDFRNVRPTNPPPPGPTLNPDEQASAAFKASMQGTMGNPVSDIFTNAYQSTEAYRELADASAVILQRAGLLDAYMNALSITEHNDPHLILAAKIINDLYVEGPPPVYTGNGAYMWTCLFSTSGVPAQAVVDVMRGKTMADIGTIVEAMGSGWLIKQLVKVGHEATTGWGTALGITDFTPCLMMEGWGNGVIDAPNFQWPAAGYITHTPDKFYLYIVAALQWYKANNSSGYWPSWTSYEIVALCDSFKTYTLSAYPYPTANYTGYYLCAEPGFMDQLTEFVNSPGFEVPDIY